MNLRRTRVALFFFCWAMTNSLGTSTEAGGNGIIPGLRNGLLFQPRGPLSLATGVWTAVVRFREKEVSKQAAEIRQHFQQIDNALEIKMEGNDSRTAEGIRNIQFLTEMGRMWEHEKAWMEAELQAGEADVRELRTELSLSRRARGLINALGDGLKWLFGTATEGDVKKLHKKIKGLEVSVGKIHHVAELQTTLIGSLSKAQQKNSRNIATLARRAKELERSVAVTREADHLTMRNIRQEMDFSQALASSIRTAGAAVMTFHHEVKRIKRAMAHTQQGTVTPAILPPASLKTTLAAVSNHLPIGWVPALPLTETPANLYKFMDIAAVALKDGWEVHIAIPLQFRSYSQFQLYEVIPIPTHLSNSSLAIKTEVSKKFFAISQDQRSHLEANKEDIARCRRTSGRTICHELTSLIQERREGCLYHSFRDNLEKATQQCKRTLVKPESQIIPVTEQKWLYVLPEEETFSMQCATGDGRQPTKGFRLQGTGIFSLRPGCAALGEHYIIPAHLRRQTQTPDHIQLQDMTNFQIKLGSLTLETQTHGKPRLNQTELDNIIEAGAEEADVFTLKELKKMMKEWKKPSEDDEWMPLRHVSHTSLTLGVASAMGVTVLVICSCCKRQRKFIPRSLPQSTSPHPSSQPAAPHPDTESISQVQTRITRLEAITFDLQKKMDKVAAQEAAITSLKRKYEQLTALL